MVSCFCYYVMFTLLIVTFSVR